MRFCWLWCVLWPFARYKAKTLTFIQHWRRSHYLHLSLSHHVSCAMLNLTFLIAFRRAMSSIMNYHCTVFYGNLLINNFLAQSNPLNKKVGKKEEKTSDSLHVQALISFTIIASAFLLSGALLNGWSRKSVYACPGQAMWSTNTEMHVHFSGDVCVRVSKNQMDFDCYRMFAVLSLKDSVKFQSRSIFCAPGDFSFLILPKLSVRFLFLDIFLHEI